MKELIVQAINGDRKSLRELLLMHQNLVESVVRKFTREPSIREDVMQNVFMKTVLSIKDFSEKCRFSTWLYRIAVNECIDANRTYVRKKIRNDVSGTPIDLFPDLNATDGLSNAMGKEANALLQKAIESLPVGMRTAFELYYIREMTGAEAAHYCNITLPAFFVRLRDAREHLKKSLVIKGVVVC